MRHEFSYSEKNSRPFHPFDRFVDQSRIFYIMLSNLHVSKGAIYRRFRGRNKIQVVWGEDAVNPSVLTMII